MEENNKKSNFFYLIVMRDEINENIMRPLYIHTLGELASRGENEYDISFMCPRGIVVFPPVKTEIKSNAPYLAKVVYNRKRTSLKALSLMELEIGEVNSYNPYVPFHVKEWMNLYRSTASIEKEVKYLITEAERKLDKFYHEYEKLKNFSVYADKNKLTEILNNIAEKLQIKLNEELNKYNFYSKDYSKIYCYNIDRHFNIKKDILEDYTKVNFCYYNIVNGLDEKENLKKYTNKHLIDWYYNLPKLNPITLANIFNVRWDGEQKIEELKENLKKRFNEIGETKIDISKKEMSELFYGREFDKGKYTIILSKQKDLEQDNNGQYDIIEYIVIEKIICPNGQNIEIEKIFKEIDWVPDF